MSSNFTLNYFFRSVQKKLRLGYISLAGRNFSGKICVHHRGGGNKRRSFLVDFYRRINCYGEVCRILKTSFFSSFIALVLYENGLASYILSSGQTKLGDRIFSGIVAKLDREFWAGSALPIRNIGLFAYVNNVERYPYAGSTLVRAAGTRAVLATKSKNSVLLKLNSGWNIRISSDCICSVGSTSNHRHKFFCAKKAGYSRALGIRPTVRGVVMNPCDHPHGGGEGRKSPPAAAVSPWGRITKGVPTTYKKYFMLKQKKFKKFK